MKIYDLVIIFLVITLTNISDLPSGTENRTILIMDPNGVTVMKSINLPSVPVYMAIVGTYEVEYRIVVACRNGNLYTIKKGKLMGHVFELESQPCGLVIIDKQIMVACMDNAVHSFHFKGKKNYSIYLPCGITNIELLSLSRIKTVKVRACVGVGVCGCDSCESVNTRVCTLRLVDNMAFRVRKDNNHSWFCLAVL